jgi:hypothetical protein
MSVVEGLFPQVTPTLSPETKHDSTQAIATCNDDPSGRDGTLLIDPVPAKLESMLLGQSPGLKNDLFRSLDSLNFDRLG